jgi:hypothetical protein
MSEFQQCPFDECDWTTASPMHEVEVDAVEGGWDRLALHMRVVHGAMAEPDIDVWDDGCWAASLFGARYAWQDGEPQKR